RLRLGHARVEVDLHDLRHAQPELAPDLSRHELRDQRPRPLSRAAELQHIGAVVVSFDDRRQRASLAERRDVAGCGDGTNHGILAVTTWPRMASVAASAQPPYGKSLRRSSSARPGACMTPSSVT